MTSDSTRAWTIGALFLGRLVALSLILAVSPVAAQTDTSRDRSATSAPNIVLIVSDDEDVRIHARAMKRVRSLIARRGTVFENAFVTFPLCCPSRASILRGQYPHNTGVVANRAPNGGFVAFRRLGLERSTIATWLQASGYRTAYYGKYLNGYRARSRPPPGWDEWHAVGAGGYGQFDYTLNENGTPVDYGNAAEDYLTDVISQKARAHIEQWSVEGRPFFLHISPSTPHSPYVPAPRHDGLFQDAELPRLPSFNEADVSDKPRVWRTLPRLDADDIEDITRVYRRRLESLQAIDELVGSVVETLARTGQLTNTYIVYTSDNGYHLGEHRMKAGKDSAFDEDIRVPLLIRGPGVVEGQTRSELVLNNDLAPTFAALAGAPVPDFVDGRSIAPLLEGNAPLWRKAFLVRRIGMFADLRVRRQANAIALRTERYTFVGYDSGQRELYDNAVDPYQLDNIVSTAGRELLDQLGTRLTRLKVCREAVCRYLEDRPLGH